MFVNCVNKKFDLKVGFVSKTLLVAGGDAMQMEINSRPSVKEAGDIIVTNGYSLHCKFVCHGYCPRWSDNNDSAADVSKIKALPTGYTTS